MARFAVPDGWTAQAYQFALDVSPAQGRACASHAGAAKFAYNRMLARVKAVMDQRAAERTYGIADDALTPAQGWSLPALRRTWNQVKDGAAPWWPENSKEAYNTGLDSLARALGNWSESRSGGRAGGPVGFPRFKNRHSRRSVRFTTGIIRVEAGRHHVTLPRLGRIKAFESTRKLARRLENGTARILSATLSYSRGRWVVSFQTLVQRARRSPAHAGKSEHPVVGVDVGVKDLMVVAAPDGTEVDRIPAPKSLTHAQNKLRALQRKAARQLGPYDSLTKSKREPSRRWQRTQARVAKTHSRAANVRRDVLHKATSRLAQQHQVVVVETLNASGMRSAGGARKRGLNRALADAALAEIRRMLTYKTHWYDSTLVQADRWYPSSKTCSACGGRKPNLALADRTYVCEHCGLVLDRDRNAAINLARLGETHLSGESSPAGSGPVAGRGATQKTNTTQVVEAAGWEASTPHQQQLGQTGTVVLQGTAAR